MRSLPNLLGTWRKRYETYFFNSINTHDDACARARYEGIATGTRWCIEDLEKGKPVSEDGRPCGISVAPLGKPVLAAVKDEQKEKETLHERMGIRTLDAKWLDPECWQGCQSLVFKHRCERYEGLLRRVLEWCEQDNPNFEIDAEAIRKALPLPDASNAATEEGN